MQVEGVVYISYDYLSNVLILLIIKSIMPILVTVFVSCLLYNLLNSKIDPYVKSVAKVYWFTYLLCTVFLILSYLTGQKFETFVYEINELASKKIIYDISLLNTSLFYYAVWSFILATLLLYKETTRINRNSEIIKLHRIKKEKLDNFDNVPLNYDKNIFISGKNGSGKTVAISNFTARHIEDNEFCIIMDGKGDNGEYSLYDIVTKLCIKKNRKLYIINQTIPEETHSYNPFKNCNATQIKDMLINMSEWSEEHYKALASEYFQAVADFMIKANINISFNSLIETANDFMNTLEMYKLSIDVSDYSYYINVHKRCFEAAEGSLSRFSTLAHGEGRRIFDSNRRDFNLKQAYRENAVVLVLLNKLVYTDFARGVGKLVLNDIKNVLGDITKIKGKHEKFLCVFDELSVYFCDMIVDVVNKSRSLGGTNILSTQTVADMDVVNENIRRSVIGNMHGFYLLKQADDKSAETLANAIGTKKKAEITSKLDSFGKTGDGTSKIVDEFKVHPNDLKELPLGIGYWIDTMSDGFKPYRIKMPYIDVENIESYIFRDI